MTEKNKKLQSIEENGQKLIWKFGLKRVTVEEICEVAKVSKMTFYKYFDNKEKLAIYLLKEIFDSAIAEYREVFDSTISFEEKMKAVVEMKLKFARDISKEFLKDIYGNDFPGLQAFTRQVSADNMEMIQRDFSEAQWNGEIRKDIKIDFLMYFLNKSIEMISDEKLVKMYSSISEMIRELTGFFFYGIIEREK